MFEAAELGHRVEKRVFARKVPVLREALLAAQYRLLKSASFPVIVLVNGVDGSGKGETVNVLNEWMDPRHIITHAFPDLSDEERERPPMWRFWRALPPKGRIGILFGNWYTDPILARVMGKGDEASFDASLARIRHFERMLAAEGALLVKLWFHLSRKQQKHRLETLEAKKETRWRVTKTDWRRLAQVEAFHAVCERAIRESSTGDAPWTLVEGADARYRYLTVGSVLLEAMTNRLDALEKGVRRAPAAGPEPPSSPPAADGRTVLSGIDYGAKLTDAAYEKKLERYQNQLGVSTRRKSFAKRSLILVFEGMDAAGKGSTIRRLTAALDARHYAVVPVAAPTEEERAQPYLWRFWRHLPRRGRVTIFDRSWYGRVLVERVEGFCSEADWRRAYHEINDFEEQLVDAGGIVLKFWLTISSDMQLRRFRERQKTPFKRFKITEEDWRNRKKWSRYEPAVCDMIERTSTEIAPWHVIPSNDKRFARVEVLRTVTTRLSEAL